MSAERRDVALAVAALALVAILTAGMVVGRSRSDLLFYACALLQGCVGLAAGRLAATTNSRAVLPLFVAAAILLRLWFVFQMPTLSGDIYRYIWDGRVVNAGFNPYLHIPADPALASLRDPAQYGLIDKRDYAVTIYPPVAEAIFAAVTRISSSVLAMKAAMVLFEAVAVVAVLGLLTRLRRPHGGIAAYLLHPAPIWEIAGNGHLDAAMMAFVYAGFLWWRGVRPYGPALLLTLGTLAKFSAALGLPALWRPFQVRLPLFVLLVAVACYLPFASAGSGVLGFLPSYAHEQGLDSGQGFLAVALLQHLGLNDPILPKIYIALATALLLAVALWTRKDGRTDLRSVLGGTAALLLLFLLLLSPTFPWYALAVLPMTVLLDLWSPFVLLTGGFLLYGFNADAPPFLPRWSLAIGAGAAAACYDLWRMRRQETAG